jgi:hypothetical protein
LVKRAVLAQQLFPVLGILICPKQGAAKPAALHLHQLVNEHIALGANIPLKPPTPKNKCLAKSASVGELGKVKVNAGYAFKRQGLSVTIIGQGQGI